MRVPLPMGVDAPMGLCPIGILYARVYMEMAHVYTGIFYCCASLAIVFIRLCRRLTLLPKNSVDRAFYCFAWFMPL